MSLVRDNLMTRPGYSPYCGSMGYYLGSNCHWPRTVFVGEQFRCPCCGWVSGFDAKFISEYKTKWGLN